MPIHEAPDGRRVARIRMRRVVSLAATLMLVLTAGAVRAFPAARIYREAADSVVLVFGFEKDGAGSTGTGTVLTRDGLVLTNNHVITQGEGGGLFSSLVVYFKPARVSGDTARDLVHPHPVEVIARDAQLDLALLRVVDPPGALRPIEVGDSEEVEIGEDVAAIGHPRGGGLWTLTTGTISSKRSDQSRQIFQTDAAINPGNSGGPLLDTNARLVGINTFVRRVNEQGLPLEGLNYALRAQLALDWVNRQGVARLVPVSRGPIASGQRKPETSAVESAPRPGEAPRPSFERTEAAVEHSPASASSPRDRDSGADAFTGADGTRMYGVPNLENDLDETLRHVRAQWSALSERRDASIEEMDRLFKADEDF